MSTIDALLALIKEYGVLLTAIAALITITVGLQRIRISLLQMSREQFRIQVEALKEKRDEEKLAIQERRLAEVNVKIDHTLILTDPSQEASAETPFVVFTLKLENIGDGPVDILASLASARIMNSKFKPGIGLHSRDVEWDDFEKHFWNHSDPDGLFTGTSTTRPMISSKDEFLRLAAHEHGDLRRIDGVNNVPLLIKRAPIYVNYRVFLVSRGYPLGEISRQLGAHPPQIIQSIDELKLQFRNLAQPNYARWQDVQRAMLNLNRMAFKVATGEEDILGQLAKPDAFRFFLLHHQDFIVSLIYDGVSMTFDEVVNQFWEKFYPDHLLPKDFGRTTDLQFRPAQEFCQARLAPILTTWERFKRTVSECHEYNATHGYPAGTFTRDGDPNGVTPSYLREGYPARIHDDPFYRDRWLGLMREGYLISRPYSRTPNQDQLLYDEQDIPADPRVLEPFVMRTHYLLDTLNIDHSKEYGGTR